jgi:hypothetical protein
MSTTTVKGDPGEIPDMLKRALEPSKPVPAPAPPAPHEYKFHQYSELFPLMDTDGSEFKGLIANIKAHGLREPIVLFHGEILEGRNRYLAIKQFRQPMDEDFTQYDVVKHGQPLHYVVSVNLHRRHLNESQRAYAAAQVSKMTKGDNQHSKDRVSTAAAAALMNVSPAAVKVAKKLTLDGDPELQRAVRDGKVRLGALASGVLTKPKAQQMAAVQQKKADAAANRAKSAKQPEPPPPAMEPATTAVTEMKVVLPDGIDDLVAALIAKLKALRPEDRPGKVLWVMERVRAEAG